MISRLKDAVIQRDEKKVAQALEALDKSDNWSLVSVIDELALLLLMECNLRYANFHQIKMSLFLRRLALRGYFSKPTERAVARLIALDLVRKSWVRIQAERSAPAPRDVSSLIESMVEELDGGNVHNAFYYASSALEREPELLLQTLLKLGAASVPHTLGHSLSCFLPVVSDLVYADHPAAMVGLLSYVMCLARYEAPKGALEKDFGSPGERLDYGSFLKLCASGDGIVNLHHMITFYSATEWEKAPFNGAHAVPYGVLVDWIKGKKVDRAREKRVAKAAYSGPLPEDYEAFRNQFSFERLDESVAFIFRMLEEKPTATIDWLFRFYADLYSPDSWDEHWYTSLYSALELYLGDVATDEVACRMALDQALRYFADGVGR